MNGKGSRRRPPSVPKAKMQKNWDRIFGKKCDEKHCGGAVGDGTCYLCKAEAKYETYYLCVYCMEEVHTLPPDGIDYCQSCDRIVEGNTLKCIRELDE